MTVLSPERIEEITRRAAAATEGPWEYRDDQNGCFVCSVSPNAPQCGFEDGPPVDLLSDGADADWEFMAHARSDIPDLLSDRAALITEHETQVSALHEEIIALRRDLDEARKVDEAMVERFNASLLKSGYMASQILDNFDLRQALQAALTDRDV